MSDTAPRPEKPRRRRVSAVEALLVVGIVALLVNIVMPSVNRRRELKLAEAAQRQCPRRLNQLGMSLQMYQNDNAGAIPPDLDALQQVVRKELGAETWRLFTCPYATARGNPPCTEGVACATWYVYCVPPGVMNVKQITDSGRAVCAYEPLGNHDGLGMMVLYWDGHVSWHDAPEAKRIQAEVAAGHNPPRADASR